jgi:hypothetical protein
MPQFFTDPNAWTALVALVAIVLSQFPPLLPRLLGLLRAPKLVIAAGDDIGITHYLGRIYFMLFIQIENAGVGTVSVIRLDTILRLVDQDTGNTTRWMKRFPVTSYIDDIPGGSNRSLILGSIPLSPGDVWQHAVKCVAASSEAERDSRKHSG